MEPVELLEAMLELAEDVGLPVRVAKHSFDGDFGIQGRKDMQLGGDISHLTAQASVVFANKTTFALDADYHFGVLVMATLVEIEFARDEFLGLQVRRHFELLELLAKKPESLRDLVVHFAEHGHLRGVPRGQPAGRGDDPWAARPAPGSWTSRAGLPEPAAVCGTVL